jgi:hypothetical protein
MTAPITNAKVVKSGFFTKTAHGGFDMQKVLGEL